MKHLMRLLAFRALSPDDGAGSGGAAGGGAESPANDASDDHFSDAAADAAYEAATGDTATPGEQSEDDDEEVDVEDDPNEGEDDPVADAETPDPDPADDPADPAAAAESGAFPTEILERYPAVKTFVDMEAGLLNPETATETARTFVETIAKYHNLTPEQLLGYPATAAATEQKPEAQADAWREKGFASKEDFDAAPEWEREGYDSAGELKLAKELAELKASLQPLAQEQAATKQQAVEAQAKADWEKAIGGISPRAIAAIKAETGWEATPEQVLEAARAFPQLASQPGKLADAIYAHHGRTIALAGKGQAATKTKSVVPEMPNGQRRQGSAVVDPLVDGYEAFADSIASQY